jgi:hypothetical protein
MPVKLVLSLPAPALAKLMNAYRSGDPELQPLLKELKVLAIQPEGEYEISVWEDDGGRCS